MHPNHNVFRYEYRVAAENKAGKVYSDWAQITTSEGVPEVVEPPQIVHVRGTQVSSSSFA